MSTLANWSYVYDLTVWPCEFDEAGQPVFGTPFLLLGDWAAGGEAVTDRNGTQIVPKSTYFFEAEDGATPFPKVEDYILRGDRTALAEPPAEAEKVAYIGGWGMQAFGTAELPDWKIVT